MNNKHILAMSAALALASVAAHAQTPATPVAKARVQLDANGDGAIDRAEAARAPKLAGKFDQLDLDKDGKLDAGERGQLRGKRHGGRHAGMMMRADTDKDGRISRAEAEAAQAGAGERFERMDANKDGYIDRADMQARIAKRRGECFDKADADRNGQLSRAEFERMGEACGPMRAGPRNLPRNNPNPGPLPPRH